MPAEAAAGREMRGVSRSGRLARGAARVAAVGLLVWGGLAIHYACAWRGPVADALAVVFVAAGLAILGLVRPARRRILAFGLLAAVLFGWWSTVRPSNERHWQADVARPPFGEVVGDRLTLHEVRNFDYRSETDFDERWETRTYDLSQIVGLDLFLSYWGSPWIAHTILSWRFRDGQALAISIETRKEVGESYDPIAGFFRQYELFYVVADERDLVRLRTNYRGENVFLYPLRVPPERARRILLDYVATMNALAEHPVFYNAGTDNCTTGIRTHIQHIGAAMPWDYRILVNGKGDEMLYERGAIDTSRPFAVVKQESSIDERANAADQDPRLSARIRAGLVVPPLVAAPSR